MLVVSCFSLYSRWSTGLGKLKDLNMYAVRGTCIWNLRSVEGLKMMCSVLGHLDGAVRFSKDGGAAPCARFSLLPIWSYCESLVLGKLAAESKKSEPLRIPRRISSKLGRLPQLTFHLSQTATWCYRHCLFVYYRRLCRRTMLSHRKGSLNDTLLDDPLLVLSIQQPRMLHVRHRRRNIRRSDVGNNKYSFRSRFKPSVVRPSVGCSFNDAWLWKNGFIGMFEHNFSEPSTLPRLW